MKTKRILSLFIALAMIMTMFVTVSSASSNKGTVVYQKSEDWSISGEHNYLWVTSDLGLETGKKYIIEFGLTVPTIDGWPSFMFDWRSSSNVSKTNVGWNGYIGLTGFFNDGSNDCVSNAGEVWSATVGREGGIVNYDYSIVWDTATSKFDITIDYTTPNRTTGTITDTFTASSTYSDGDVLKFWANGAAVIRDLTIYNYTEASTNTIYTVANGWLKGDDATEADGALRLGKKETKFAPVLTSGKKYEITFDIDVPDTIDASSWGKPACITLYANNESKGTILYYLSGAWMDGTKSTTYGDTGDGKVRVLIDTESGAWSIDAPGVGTLLSGSVDAETTNFAIGLNCEEWIEPSEYPVDVRNVKVAEYTGDELVTFPQETALPNEDFEDKTNKWVTTRDNPMYHWFNGEIKEETDGNKYLYLNSGDIYPTIFGDGTGKYKVTFKVKPGAYTAATDWSHSSVALSLGCTFGDLRLGNSSAVEVENADVNWLQLFGQDMSISEADGWIDIELLYDFDEQTVTGTASTATGSVTGSGMLAIGEIGYVSGDNKSAKIWFSTTHVALCIDDLVAVEVGESKAPALTAESVKVYYGETEQKLTEVDPFADKIVVEFGQKMLETDLTADNIYVKDAQGNKIACSAVENDKTSYTMKFENGFAEGTYTIHIGKIKNIANVETLQVYEFIFKVVGSIRAELVSIVQNGTEVKNVAGLSAGNATINVKYRNTKDTTPVLHIIAAYYNGDKLVKAEYVKQETNKGSDDVNCGVTYTVPSVTETYKEVQFMIWDGFNTMIPLSAPIILGE